MLNEYPDILNVKDIQSIFRIGRNKAYSLIKENRIKSIKIDNQYKIPKIYVAEFMQSSQLMNKQDYAIIDNHGPVIAKEGVEQ